MCMLHIEGKYHLPKLLIVQIYLRTEVKDMFLIVKADLLTVLICFHYLIYIII